MKRFWSKVDKTTPRGCWEWRGAVDACSYGRFSYYGINTCAHRVAWELTNGMIANGKHIRHSCDNPSCVNPHHLQIGTHQDNMDDKVQRNRQARGRKSNQSHLAEEDIKSMRKEWESQQLNHQELKQKYNVSSCTVSNVVNYKTWKHIKPKRS